MGTMTSSRPTTLVRRALHPAGMALPDSGRQQSGEDCPLLPTPTPPAVAYRPPLRGYRAPLHPPPQQPSKPPMCTRTRTQHLQRGIMPPMMSPRTHARTHARTQRSTSTTTAITLVARIWQADASRKVCPFSSIPFPCTSSSPRGKTKGGWAAVFFPRDAHTYDQCMSWD